MNPVSRVLLWLHDPRGKHLRDQDQRLHQSSERRRKLLGLIAAFRRTQKSIYRGH